MKKILLIMLFINSSLKTNPYFSNYYTPTTSLLKPHSSNISFKISQGKTHKAYTNTKQETNILNMFGTHTLHLIGIVQNKSVLDTISKTENISQADWGILHVMTHEVITALNNNTSLGTYGQFNVEGNFSYQQESLSITTPEYKGFHLNFLLPFSEFSFSNVTYKDLTPTTGNGGFNLIHAPWNDFITTMNSIFTGYQLSKENYTERGIGDLEIGLYYHKNFDHKFHTALQATTIFPTGKKKNENEAFSCAHGNDGHYGFKSGLTLQKELKEYFSLQCSFETTLFSTHVKKMRLKTHPNQQGYLFLLDSTVRRHKGALSSFSSKFILTPETEPIVLSLAHIYTHAKKTTIELLDSSLFEEATVNNDPRFFAWNRHSLEGSCTYHFNNNISSYDNSTDTSFTIKFNIPLSGKNIFKTKAWQAEGSLIFNYAF